MRLKYIILSLTACVGLMGLSQPVQQQEPMEWYLDEVVSETFVGRNYFDYYYMPSASDMDQQRAKGEVTYFLNSPEGLNSKKVRDMIDRLMASYDDIRPVGSWQMTTSTYWKEFRFEKNKFHFNVKRKALDDGTYYVSVTETANYYKSLGKKNNKEVAQTEEQPDKDDKPYRRSTRDRRPVTQEEADAAPSADDLDVDDEEAAAPAAVPMVSQKQRRETARAQEQAQKQEERLAKRRAQEEQRAREKAQKEAEKLRKAEEKKRKAEEKLLKKEEQRQRREQERQQREQARLEKEAAARAAASKYHYDDVALWLSEKYDFTQTAADDASCTMFSTAIKDAEMAKLAIKNALKGSNARMAVPWRVNGETQAIETGYTVDDHVLVFTIGQNDEGKVLLTITEISNEQFELFKQSMNK